MTTEAFFLQVAPGQRFCLFHPSGTCDGAATRGQVVYVHPFAEEMNKSRRMAALQARALAAAGFDVLQIDLNGCGDSSGDFGQATWDSWVTDIIAACSWLRARAALARAQSPPPALWLWGLRAGCLLAVQAAQQLQEPCNFLFWAPTYSGKLLLQRFLRLEAAADLASGNAKTVMEALRADLASGHAVEVAGYRLAPALAAGMERANLTPNAASARGARVEWFELSTRADATLTPVSTKAVAEWEQRGYPVRSRVVHGPSFWQTTEIEDAPELITSTTTALMEARPR